MMKNQDLLFKSSEMHEIPFLYGRLQAFSWANSSPRLINTVDAKGIQSLISEWQKIAYEFLFLDCTRIERFLSHSLTSLKEYLKSNALRTVTIVHTGDGGWNAAESDALRDELKRQLRGIDNHEHSDYVAFGSVPHETLKSVQSIVENCLSSRKLEDASIREYVKSSYFRFDREKRLTSTPLKALGIFKAASMIGRPSVHIQTMLRMADEIERVCSEHSGQEIRLMACSRNSACFAFTLHWLCNSFGVEGVDIVDRLGPSGKFVEEYSSSPTNMHYSYILVTDFIVGGAELRAAVAHAHERGKRILKAVCVGSVVPAEEFHSCGVRALVQLAELGLKLEYRL